MDDKGILLVEDNPDDVALTLRAFRKNHLRNEIVTVNDGMQALEYLFGTGAYVGRDTSQQPAVILLDVKLPKLDGLQVLERLRGNPQTRFIPVIMLTTSKEHDDLVRSYTLGANSYIRKPVDFEQFMFAIQQVGLYWLVMNEVPK